MRKKVSFILLGSKYSVQLVVMEFTIFWFLQIGWGEPSEAGNYMEGYKL
jgi:hypothetical protein